MSAMIKVEKSVVVSIMDDERTVAFATVDPKSQFISISDGNREITIPKTYWDRFADTISKYVAEQEDKSDV